MWKSICDSLSLGSSISLVVEDATRLSFADNSFDIVFSVSVIEHIDGSGDSGAMREINRVLRNGGSALISVMYDHVGYEVWKNKNVYHKTFSKGVVFYERWYNERQIEERLLKPSGLELVSMTFAGERYYRVHKKLLDRLINSQFLIGNTWSVIEPFVGLLNIRKYGAARELREGIVLLALKKK